ncbi:MAG: hypothetical protein J0I11_04375 [Actinobacteria bacterium]|nr:hypothetical protein [Actinomycetota bacterium]
MSKVLAEVDEIRDRSWADRPSPAIPLLLMALLVTGALIVALIRASQMQVLSGGGIVLPPPDSSSTGFSASDFALVNGPVPSHDRVRLAYWVIASIIAYLAALWIARRQGYRRGMWVNRRPLVVAGLLALAGAVIIVVGFFAPADLLLRGNLPLLAIAVGIVVWAMRERRPGLWVVAAVMVPLTLLANLYNMELVLFHLGVPVFADAEEIVNLGTVAVVLFVASAIFGVLHRRDAKSAQPRGAR